MPDSTFQFALDGSVLGAKSAKSLLVATAQSDVLAALQENRPFPERTIAAGEFSVAAEGGKDFVLRSDPGEAGAVSFRAKAEAALLITPERGTMLESLPVSDSMAEGLAGAEDSEASYALFTWGYDLAGAGQGTVALGAGVGAQFGVDAKRVAGFAVVKLFRRDTPSPKVLRELAKAWRLPKRVETASDLPPGTWLVVEVDGSLALSLGVQAGYDFSWVRDTVLSGLTGDIGLRVEAGLSATVGCEASGRYALVLRRDSLKAADRRLRLQLFKQRKQGWSFALDARATVQANVSDFAPDSLDGLLRAILGVHAAQVLDDLQAVEDFADPEKSLGELLAGAGVDRAKKLLGDVTGLDVESELQTARDELAGLLQTWQGLDERVASGLWSELGHQEAIDAVRDLAGQVQAALADDASLRALLSERLGDGGFLATPAGKWLESVAGDGILPLVTSSSGLQTLREAAAKTLDVLDGGRLETLIGRLKSEIEKVFRLDKVEAAIQAAIEASDPQKLDAWLRERLARFLDAQPTVQRLQEVQGAITAIRQKGEDFYRRTLEAVQRQYQLALAATYRTATTREALVDVELDFASGGAEDELRGLLGEALRGDLTRLLLRELPGVTLHVAKLTHQIDRRAQVQVSLPWYSRETKDVARSLAAVSALEDDGRLLLYEGKATDEVLVTKAKVRRDSQLSVLVQLRERPGIHVHESGTMSYSYSFCQALAEARTALLGRQLGGFIEAYFPGEFPADGDGETSGSVHNWLAALDERLDPLQNNGRGNLGNTLLTLQVSVNEEVADAWLNAPPAGHPAYRQMSRSLQALLKELIPWIYFRDPDRCRPDFVPAAVLFAYAALPPLTDVRLKGQDLVPAKGDGLYWDFQDRTLLEAVLGSEATAMNLETTARRTKSLLEKLPGFGKRVAAFANGPAFAQTVRASVFDSKGRVRPQLIDLLDCERQIVGGAASAGAAMAKFRAKAKQDPEEAVAALARFGDALAKAFNKSLRNVYLKDSLRPFGTLLFAEAAGALRGGLRVETAAFLQLAILESSAAFPPADFPRHSQPKAEDVLVEENLVSL